MVFCFLMTLATKFSFRAAQYNLLCQLIFLKSSKLYAVFLSITKMKPSDFIKILILIMPELEILELKLL